MMTPTARTDSRPCRYALCLGAFFLLSLGLSATARGQCDALPQGVTVRNTATPVGDERYECVIYVEGSKAALDGVAEVKYTLHPSLPNPRQKKKRNTRYNRFPFGSDPFIASEEFNVKVKIEYLQGKDTYCTYRLKLFAGAGEQGR